MKQIYLSTFKSLCLLLIAVMYSSSTLNAQCTAPTSIGTPGIVHASCPGNGQITVSGMVPTAAAIAPDYYQYALYDTLGTTIVAPYQSSNVLVNIDAGTYDIYVRRVCSTGFSTPVTRRVVVNNTEQSPFINSITLNRASQCNNGRFTVSASGSAPLQYALVNSLTAPEPPGSYVRAPQSSNVFDSLAAGTYYVRVYNACGNAVTQAITVPAYTPTTTFTDEEFFALGCDSFQFRFYLRNFLRVLNTADTAKARMWMIWPSGNIDTLAINNSSPATGTTIYIHSAPGHLSYIDPLYNTAATFYENLPNYPYVFRFGYKDICGNVFTDSFTLYEPTQKQLEMFISESDPLTTCDSVAYRFRIQTSRPGMVPNQLLYHAFRNMHNFMYSTDSGATWINAKASNTISTFGYNNYSDYIQFKRGVPIELRVAYCGDTLTHILTPAAQPPLDATASATNTVSCIGYGGLLTSKQNAVGDTLGYEMLSAPSGQPLISYFTHYVGGLSAGSGYYLPQYQNLLPGSYTIRIWDTFGVDCPRFIDRTVNLQPFNLDFNFEQQCNGGLRVFETTSPQLASFAYMRVRVLDQLGNSVLGPYFGSTSGPNTTNIPAADINSLPNGNYTIRVYKNVGTSYPYLDTCTIVDKPWLKQPNILSLTPSKFVPGCPGGTGAIVAIAQGGRAPYSFILRDAANNIVAPNSTGSNIYNNLVANATYTLQVIDSCGTVENRTMSVGEDLAVFARNFSTMPCPGDDVTLYVDSMPGVNYQWFKNGSAVSGATTHELFLPNIQNPADSGAYQVEIEIGDCVVMVASFMLDPDSCGTPLPVQLSYFNAYKANNTSVLNWATVSEDNNKGFDIEHSTDGKSWRSIGFVNSLSEGTSSVTQLDYNFVDNTPVNGNNLYRLKQIDRDGKSTISTIRRVVFDNLTATITAYPNPAREYINIVGLTGAETLKLYDATGRILKFEKNTGLQAHKLSLVNITNGIYNLVVTDKNGHVTSVKIVINK